MTQTARTMSVREFDAMPRAGDRTYELIDGVPVATGIQSEIHDRIAMNIAMAMHLKPAMHAQGCRIYAGDEMWVQASGDPAGINKLKPDVFVRCGLPIAESYVVNPIVLIEVLSSDTMDRDRGVKLAFYKALPSAQHVVLAHSDQKRVEHYVRTRRGWQCRTLSTAQSVLDLDVVGFRMPIDAIYFGVSHDEAPQPNTSGSAFRR
jgi:Uma2 family endonuclease